MVMTDPAMSQNGSDDERPYKFGLKGGLNQSSLKGYNNESLETRSGYQFGLFLSSNILDDWFNIQNLQLRVEVNYLNMGTRITDNNLNSVIFYGVELFESEELHGYEFERQNSGPFTADEIFEEDIYSTFSYRFIESPFHLIYSFPLGRTEPYILAGPTVSMMLDMDYTFTLNTPDNNSYTQTELDENVNQHVSKFNLGTDLGLGINFLQRYFIEAHYSFGLTNTLEFYDNTINHRGLMANLGIQF